MLLTTHNLQLGVWELVQTIMGVFVVHFNLHFLATLFGLVLVKAPL